MDKAAKAVTRLVNEYGMGRVLAELITLTATRNRGTEEDRYLAELEADLQVALGKYASRYKGEPP